MSDEALINVHIDALRHPDPSGHAHDRLLNAVQTHVRDESDSISAYQRILGTCTDPVLAAVMDLILQDEQRHHTALAHMAARLQAAFDWAPVPGTSAPSSGAGTSTEELRVLAADERRGALALRGLAYQCLQADDELTRVLLEAMAMDSEKHAFLLDFAGRRLALAHR